MLHIYIFIYHIQYIYIVIYIQVYIYNIPIISRYISTVPAFSLERSICRKRASTFYRGCEAVEYQLVIPTRGRWRSASKEGAGWEVTPIAYPLVNKHMAHIYS